MKGETWIRTKWSGDPRMVCVWTHLGGNVTLLLRENGSHEVRSDSWDAFNFHMRAGHDLSKDIVRIA